MNFPSKTYKTLTITLASICLTTLTYLNPPSANANPTPEEPNTTNTTTINKTEGIPTPETTDNPTTDKFGSLPCLGRLSTPKDNTHTATLALDNTHEIECGGGFLNLPPRYA